MNRQNGKSDGKTQVAELEKKACMHQGNILFRRKGAEKKTTDDGLG